MRFCAKAIPVFLFISIFLWNSCRKSDGPNEGRILSVLYPDQKSSEFQIIRSQPIHFIHSDNKQVFQIIRDVQSEGIFVWEEKSGSWDLIFQKKFYSASLGPLEYNPETASWIAVHSSPKNSYLFPKVKILPLKETGLEMISVETILDEPPLGVFSLPMVFWNSQVVFDGLSILKDTLEENNQKRATLDWGEDSSLKIQIGENQLEYRFNGWEFVDQRPFSFYFAGCDKSNLCSWKNEGETVSVTLEISAQPGEQIEIDGSNFSKGQLVSRNKNEYRIRLQSLEKNEIVTIPFLSRPDEFRVRETLSHGSRQITFPVENSSSSGFQYYTVKREQY